MTTVNVAVVTLLRAFVTCHCTLTTDSCLLPPPPVGSFLHTPARVGAALLREGGGPLLGPAVYGGRLQATLSQNRLGFAPNPGSRASRSKSEWRAAWSLVGKTPREPLLMLCPLPPDSGLLRRPRLPHLRIPRSSRTWPHLAMTSLQVRSHWSCGGWGWRGLIH